VSISNFIKCNAIILIYNSDTYHKRVCNLNSTIPKKNVKFSFCVGTVGANWTDRPE